MAVEPKLIAIIGPTASGKSELALELARRLTGEILSVDSMQLYRGMDIGTAKPTPAERAAAPHHLIDIAEPNEIFTAARFVEMADKTIADAARRKLPLIATGGTPLYFKSLFQGLFQGPGADETVRDRLRNQSNESLHQQLSQIDPAAAARIHLNDTKRLIRAIEVHQLTGRPITDLQTEWSNPTSRHNAIWIGLHWDKEELNRRINARTKAMFAAGWLEETRALLARYGQLSQTACEATGYRELIDHLQGKLSLDDAFERIKIATRQLARRQMKWFRRFPNGTWIDGALPLETKMNRALELTQS